MRVRLLLLAVVAAAGLAATAPAVDAGAGPGEGTFRATISPPVPSQISIDDIPRDTWSLIDVALPAGSHTVSFSDVPGFRTPEIDTFELAEYGGAERTVSFIALANLRVLTSPPVPAQITLDGTPMDQWGLWTDVEPGTHEVCFGPVPDFAPPPCQTVTVTSAEPTLITGDYTPSPGAPGLADVGRLRVVTDPPLPSTVVIDGQPRSMWGLAWLQLPPGSYEVGFTDVPGFDTPATETVVVTAGETTVHTGSFTSRNHLRVSTEPSSFLNVFVDGIARNGWGLWTDLPPALYEVCFQASYLHANPPCMSADLTSGDVHLIVPVTDIDVDAPPVLLAINPSTGPPGTLVEVAVRTYPNGLGPFIRFGGNQVPTGCHTSTALAVWVCDGLAPPAEPGPIEVTVVMDGVISNPITFTYEEAPAG